LPLEGNSLAIIADVVANTGPCPVLPRHAVARELVDGILYRFN
jgi:hypothetical protein